MKTKRSRQLKDLVIFPTDAHERRFKYCLTKTPTIAKDYFDNQGRHVLAIRPKDFPKFRYVLAQNGLGHCEVSESVLKTIENLPTQFIKFVH